MHLEVWRELKKLELLSAAPRATLTHFSCSPNFLRASITRYTHSKYEKILKCLRVCIMKKYTLNSRWLVVGLVTATKFLLSEERKNKHTLSCLANFLLKDVCKKLHSSGAKLEFLKGRSRWRISVRLT